MNTTGSQDLDEYAKTLQAIGCKNIAFDKFLVRFNYGGESFTIRFFGASGHATFSLYAGNALLQSFWKNFNLKSFLDKRKIEV